MSPLLPPLPPQVCACDPSQGRLTAVNPVTATDTASAVGGEAGAEASASDPRAEEGCACQRSRESAERPAGMKAQVTGAGWMSRSACRGPGRGLLDVLRYGLRAARVSRCPA